MIKLRNTYFQRKDHLSSSIFLVSRKFTSGYPTDFGLAVDNQRWAPATSKVVALSLLLEQKNRSLLAFETYCQLQRAQKRSFQNSLEGKDVMLHFFGAVG